MGELMRRARPGPLAVWFASVLDQATQQSALVYGHGDDASDATHGATQAVWAQALELMLSGPPPQRLAGVPPRAAL